MFRSRRTTLSRRLLKCRADAATTNTATGPAVDNPPSWNSAAELTSAVQSLFKTLDEDQLETLAQAAESRGGAKTQCVLLPYEDVGLGGINRTVDVQVLFCTYFRWPDLRQHCELKPLLALCEHYRLNGPSQDGHLVCCNPYHLTRLCGPETPPPPYRQTLDCIKQRQISDREVAVVSTETGLTDPPFRNQHYSDPSESGNRFRYWCSVAYWELRTRVGRMYHVCEDQTVNIFQELPHGSGLCLGELNSEERNTSVERTRNKIGYGVCLSKEPDGVWAYNRSEHAVFVNSPTLDLPNSRTLTVRKLKPGFSIKIFDYDKSEMMKRAQQMELTNDEGPYEPNSVRISFVKGWGPQYCRQFITSCPCWVEIIFNIPQ